MPAPPEVLERERAIRLVEVLGEFHAKEESAADRDIRVPGEVGEDDDGIGVNTDDDLLGTVEPGRGEDRVGDFAGQ